jgi:uncharacterized protein DUF4388
VQPRGKDDGGDGASGAVIAAGASPNAPAAVRGFSAQLRGAGLWDLVQMECLARSHRVVQVTGEGGSGYLFFDRGQIVHATTAQRTGEAAAREILGWTHGSFQSSDRPWPSESTIRTSSEGLILQVAQARDERAASNLVAFPSRVVPADDSDRYEELELTELEEEEEGEPEMRSPGVDDAATTPKPAANGAAGTTGGRAELGAGGDFAVMMRLGQNGAVVSNRGGSEALAETVAYAHRLLELTGELLGFERFSAVECSFLQGRCMIFADSEEIVALRPRPEVNLQALREKLGL